MYFCICLCLLYIVICMHSFHSAHIFIVYNSVICTKSFNILALFYIGHLVLNYTAHFVYSTLNSYVYMHWILDLKYILFYYLDPTYTTNIQTYGTYDIIWFKLIHMVTYLIQIVHKQRKGIYYYVRTYLMFLLSTHTSMIVWRCPSIL